MVVFYDFFFSCIKIFKKALPSYTNYINFTPVAFPGPDALTSNARHPSLSWHSPPADSPAHSPFPAARSTVLSALFTHC